MEFDADLFVIGGGSGGVRGARIAAGLGARVVLAEQSRLGGTCVNIGCVPKKLFTYAAHYAHDFEDARGFGWEAGTPRFDWSTLVRNKDAEIDRLNGIYERMLANAGVTVHRERAMLTGPHTVQVGDRIVRARHILLATGGKPTRPSIPGAEHGWLSDDLFALDALPASLLIVGGGYIGLEFACIFRALGVDVTVAARSVLLAGMDEETVAHLHAAMTGQGIDVRLRCEPVALRRGDHGLHTELSGGATIRSEAVLFATGRRPNVDRLGLEAAGVLYGHGVTVDEAYRTSVPHIHAVGDLIDRVQLTPVALAEGMWVARHLYGEAGRTPDYRNVPTAVFTQPHLATVGLTERDARELHGDVVVFTSEFRALKHTLSGRQERTFMKLIVDRSTDRVVGAHMLGPDAGEVIQGIAVAMTAGATKADFDATIGIHPTSAEEFVTMRTPRD